MKVGSRVPWGGQRGIGRGGVGGRRLPKKIRVDLQKGEGGNPLVMVSSFQHPGRRGGRGKILSGQEDEVSRRKKVSYRDVTSKLRKRKKPKKLQAMEYKR